MEITYFATFIYAHVAANMQNFLVFSYITWTSLRALFLVIHVQLGAHGIRKNI